MAVILWKPYSVHFLYHVIYPHSDVVHFKMSKVVDLGLKPKNIWNKDAKSLVYSVCLLVFPASAQNPSKPNYFLSQ